MITRQPTLQMKLYRPSADILCGRPPIELPTLNPNPDLSELKTGTPVKPALGNVYADCGFCMFSVMGAHINQTQDV